jgi:transcriptional regulator with XRE-family HTH domain
LREKKGISQEQLAFLSEVDRTFISLLERGQRQPSLTSVIRIARALDVNASEVVALVETMIADPSNRGRKA